MINSLVAYKGKTAKVIAQTDKKITIVVDEKELKVREKDIRFIHKNFEKPVATNEYDLSVLVDFYEQTMPLEELTEWLFSENNANNTWQTYLLVEDGLYFYWQKDLVFIRPQEQVEKIKEKRDAEALEKAQYDSFIKNIYDKDKQTKFVKYFEEIEQIAFDNNKKSKILEHLGLTNTPETAHKLLLKTKFWGIKNYPFLERNRVNLFVDDSLELVEDTQERQDLTHLKSYAIDNANINDADDAISIEDNRVFVHICDVASFVTPEIEAFVAKKCTTLYLPEKKLDMLPEALMAKLPLGLAETSNTWTVNFIWKDNTISDIQIILATIKSTNISYDEVDEKLNNDEEFQAFQKIALEHQQMRQDAGARHLNLPQIDVKFKGDIVEIIEDSCSTPAREMVAEFMLMAGSAVAQFAQDNEILLPFVTQEEGTFELDREAANLAPLSQRFKMTKQFGKSVIKTTPKPHFGLGLSAYVRITSPLRRYLDLVAQQQIIAFLKQKTLFEKQELHLKFQQTNQILSDVRKATNEVKLHTKLIYLQQNPNWTGEGTITMVREDKIIFCIESLGMFNAIKTKDSFELDQKIPLKVTRIDLISLEVRFGFG